MIRRLSAAALAIVLQGCVATIQPQRALDSSDTVTALAYAPAGDVLASGGVNGTVELWSTGDGARRFSVKREGGVTCLALSGDLIAAGGAEGTISLHSTRDGSTVRVLKAHDFGVAAVGFTESGLLYSASPDGEVKVWLPKKDACLTSTRYGGSEQHGFSPTGALACIVKSRGLSVGTIAEQRAPVTPNLEGRSDKISIRSLAWSPCGRAIAVAGSKGNVFIASSAGSFLRSFVAHEPIDDARIDLAFSNGGVLLASSCRKSSDKLVKIWRADRGVLALKLAGSVASPARMAFSPRGDSVAACEGGTIHVWSLPADLTPSADDLARIDEEVEKSSGPQLELTTPMPLPIEAPVGNGVRVPVVVRNLGAKTPAYDVTLAWSGSELSLGDLPAGGRVQKTIDVGAPSRGASTLIVSMRAAYGRTAEPLVLPVEVLTQAEYEQRQRPPELSLGVPALRDKAAIDLAAVQARRVAVLHVPVKNAGLGPGVGAVLVVNGKDAPGLSLPESVDVGEIPPRSERDVAVEIKGGPELKDGEATLTLRLEEKRGFSARPTVVRLPTRRLRAPSFSIASRAEIQDGSTGFANGNGNGVFESGESVELSVLVENRGEGPAPCLLEAGSSQDGIKVETEKVELPELAPGTARKAVIVVAAARTFGGPRVALALRATDPEGLSKAECELEVPFRAVTSALGVVAPHAPRAKVARGESFDVEAVVEERGVLDGQSVTLAPRPSRAGVDVEPGEAQKLGRIATGGRSRPVAFHISVRRGAALGPASIELEASQSEFAPARATISFEVVDESATTVQIGERAARPAHEAISSAPPVVLVAKVPTRTTAETLVIQGSASAATSLATVRVLRNSVDVGAGQRGIGGVAEAPRGTDPAPREREFEVTVSLELGDNRIEVVATDVRGLETRRELRVQRVTDKGRTLALVVGVSRYKSEQVRSLRFADKDAESFRDYVTRDLGVAAEQVTFLENEAATRVALVKGLAAIQRQAGASDRILIFFAGHGLAGEAPPAGGEPERYLAPYDVDASPDALAATGVAMSDVTRILRGAEARETVVLLDACYAGALGLRSGPGDPSGESLSQAFVTGRGRVVLASSRKSEPSSEDEARGHGLFTASLLEGLRGAADADRDGWVDTAELSRYIDVAVAKATGGAQQPVYKADLEAPIRFPVKAK